MGLTRRWFNRRTLNELCAQAVKLQRILERREIADKEDLGSVAFHFEYLGRLIGIREAICIVMRWDPAIHADKEGRADELVIDWWQKHDPDYWS